MTHLDINTLRATDVAAFIQTLPFNGSSADILAWGCRFWDQAFHRGRADVLTQNYVELETKLARLQQEGDIR